ncbi:MAG: nucleotide exchange factor GrpE [FCB group bacterium]|nr:nucleotide exchange factor GrpE [FCB group bacterium]
MRRKKTETDEPLKDEKQPTEGEKIEIKIDSSESGDEQPADDKTESEKDTSAQEDTTLPKSETKAEEPPESESERYMRLAAEFDNYKKRTAREFGDMIKSSNFRLLKAMIDILDNFERALDGDTESIDLKAYRQGVELIYNQFTDLLKRENVTTIEALGQSFNPNFHEAMLQQQSDEYDEGMVCGELQKGYKIGDKVLRHARVIVSSGAKKTDDEKTTPE